MAGEVTSGMITEHSTAVDRRSSPAIFVESSQGRKTLDVML